MITLSALDANKKPVFPPSKFACFAGLRDREKIKYLVYHVKNNIEKELAKTYLELVKEISPAFRQPVDEVLEEGKFIFDVRDAIVDKKGVNYTYMLSLLTLVRYIEESSIIPIYTINLRADIPGMSTIAAIVMSHYVKYDPRGLDKVGSYFGDGHSVVVRGVYGMMKGFHTVESLELSLQKHYRDWLTEWGSSVQLSWQKSPAPIGLTTFYKNKILMYGADDRTTTVSLDQAVSLYEMIKA